MPTLLLLLLLSLWNPVLLLLLPTSTSRATCHASRPCRLPLVVAANREATCRPHTAAHEQQAATALQSQDETPLCPCWWQQAKRPPAGRTQQHKMNRLIKHHMQYTYLHRQHLECKNHAARLCQRHHWNKRSDQARHAATADRMGETDAEACVRLCCIPCLLLHLFKEHNICDSELCPMYVCESLTYRSCPSQLTPGLRYTKSPTLQQQQQGVVRGRGIAANWTE